MTITIFRLYSAIVGLYLEYSSSVERNLGCDGKPNVLAASIQCKVEPPSGVALTAGVRVCHPLQCHRCESEIESRPTKWTCQLSRSFGACAVHEVCSYACKLWHWKETANFTKES